jgi:hypothetical protein
MFFYWRVLLSLVRYLLMNAVDTNIYMVWVAGA